MKSHFAAERWTTIASYFVPELVTALLLYSLPIWIDSYFIASLKSTAAYATLGTTNSLLHLLIKAAEAISVGTVIIAGQLNGEQKYRESGSVLRDSFWVTVVIGGVFAFLLSVGAPLIYWWYGVPEAMMVLGIPFLQIRAVGVLFSFIFSAFAGFLRAIKDIRMVMKIFIAGSFVFVILDYILIFGYGPIAPLGLQGSALASVIQYACMCFLAVGIIYSKSKYRQYKIHLFSGIHFAYAKQLIALSWPVLIDKSVMALAYVWLCTMVCPIGTCAVATSCAVKDMERLILLPAIAFGQIITFLVSNDWGKKNWGGIIANVKRVMFATFVLVILIVAFLMFKLNLFATSLDRTGDFVGLIQRIFPLVGVLVLFDVLQLILAGALRGSGNVEFVMAVRIVVMFGFFMPVSYVVTGMFFAKPLIQLALIYCSFYASHALMSVAYLYWFYSGRWRRAIV